MAEILRLADEGMAVLFISAELEELHAALRPHRRAA